MRCNEPSSDTEAHYVGKGFALSALLLLDWLPIKPREKSALQFLPMAGCRGWGGGSKSIYGQK